MAAGKNKILRWVRLYLDYANLSGDSRTFSSADNIFEGVDFTGWSNSVRNYLADGVRQVALRGYQAIMHKNASGNGALDLLITYAGSRQSELSLLFGSGAEPAVGDPAFLMHSVQLGAGAAFDGGAGVLQADFLPDAGSDDMNPWGVVLANEAAITATTSYAAVNNGAASANGWHANLHIISDDLGATWAILIQESTTGAWGGEETTLTTFAATGTITSEHKSGTGAVKQYVRARIVETGAGSLTPVITFARN